MSEITNIKERMEKTQIIVPVEQAGIYAVQRADIRFLLHHIEMLEAQIASLLNPKDAA